MRTRTRTSIVTNIAAFSQSLPFVRSLCGSADGGTGVVSHAARSTTYTQEHMSDELGKGKQHGCVHNSRLFFTNLGVGSSAYVFPNLSSPYGYTSFSGAGTQVLNQAAADLENNSGWNLALPGLPAKWSEDLSSINENSLIEDCFEKAHQLKADHLLNLMESNQSWDLIKDLATLFTGSAIRGYGLQKRGLSWEKAKKVWKRDLRLGVRHASSGFLAWCFGVKPILSDVDATHRYIARFAEDLKRFEAQDNSVFSRSVSVPMFFNTTPTDTYANGVLASRVQPTGQFIGPSELRYVLIVKPNNPYVTPAIKAAALVLDRFTSSPASFAWEKVPYSFVVDWFVDMRGLCRAVDQMVGFSPYQVIGFFRTRNWHVSTTVSRNVYKTCPGDNILAYHATQGQVEMKHYERILVPAGATLPTWKPRFSKNKAAISAALVTQLVLRMKRFRS